MSSGGSITRCLALLRAGDRAAAQALWERYFRRLVGLARARLRGTVRGPEDEEDVALSAFDSFYRRAERGQFPRLADRDDLWQLLFVITVRKAIDRMRRGGREPRGAGGALTLKALADSGLAGLLSPEPTPEMAAQVADECRRLLARLGEGTLRSVALWKMQGHTNDEIAAKLGCVRYTVERKLRRIRALWGREVSHERDRSG